MPTSTDTANNGRIPFYRWTTVRKNVSIETKLGLDDRGSIPGKGNDEIILLFATASRPALRQTQPPIQWVPGAFTQGVKRPGNGA